jgi:hypothetical protein
MHGSDLGQGGILIKNVFRLGFDPSDKWKYVHGLGMNSAREAIFREKLDLYFGIWRFCLPDDFARRPRDLQWANDYKAREINVVVMRYFLAMWLAFGGQQVADEFFEKGFFKNVMRFVTFMKLVGGFSSKPLPKVFSFGQ